MIADGKFVSIHYRLMNQKGELLEQTDKTSPFTYVHGAGTIIRGLEAALAGLKAGETVKITVPPNDAYGEFDEQLRSKIDRSIFPQGSEVQVGELFRFTEDDGSVIVFEVEKVEADGIVVNANHPLAGQTLRFDVEVLSVRDASAEEVASARAAEAQ